MNLRYSALRPLGNACGSPILKIICPWRMSIDQCSSPKALIIPYHLAVWASKAPETRLISPAPQFHNIDLRLDKKGEVWLTFPLSSNQPPETLDWLCEDFKSLGTALRPRSLRNESEKVGSQILTALFTFSLLQTISLGHVVHGAEDKRRLSTICGKTIQFCFWGATVLRRFSSKPVQIHTYVQFQSYSG